MNLYMITLDWDVDKADFIVAEDTIQARLIINNMYYWMPEYYDDWIIYKIPSEALSMYESTSNDDIAPSIEEQMKMNYHEWDLEGGIK